MKKRISVASLGVATLFLTLVTTVTPAMAASPTALPGLNCQYKSTSTTFSAGCMPGSKSDVGSWFTARAGCTNGKWVNGKETTLVANKRVWSTANCGSVKSTYKKGTGRYNY
ncbi:hypothetical protein [Pseudonocardia spinosispora]|uniref:hypothetical protein n=1 Tax=Pseudonocardia spinosispora TaxID=103441 RepID=UPI0012EC504A|nr:hypothetical protein [Pseudonocardia spinosispora]